MNLFVLSSSLSKCLLNIPCAGWHTIQMPNAVMLQTYNRLPDAGDTFIFKHSFSADSPQLVGLFGLLFTALSKKGKIPQNVTKNRVCSVKFNQ